MATYKGTTKTGDAALASIEHMTVAGNLTGDLSASGAMITVGGKATAPLIRVSGSRPAIVPAGSIWFEWS